MDPDTKQSIKDKLYSSPKSTSPDNMKESHKSKNKINGKSHDHYRHRIDKREKYPNGYVEDWSSKSERLDETLFI